MNNYQIIDIENWKRKIHFQVFKDYLEPAFCITFEVDITDFLNYIKEHELSFTLAMTHAVAKIANQIEEFRYRFLDGQVVLFDQVDTSLTYLESETELFKVITAPYMDNLTEYVRHTKNIIEEQKAYFTGPLGVDIIQCSPLPWISFSHISHTNSGKGQNGTPLIDWGKFVERDGHYYMPVSVQAHHSFVDGIHVGKFSEQLQEYLNSFKSA